MKPATELSSKFGKIFYWSWLRCLHIHYTGGASAEVWANE